MKHLLKKILGVFDFEKKIFYQYSSDGKNWHDSRLTEDTKYFRTATAINKPANNSPKWGCAHLIDPSLEYGEVKLFKIVSSAGQSAMTDIEDYSMAKELADEMNDRLTQGGRVSAIRYKAVEQKK